MVQRHNRSGVAGKLPPQLTSFVGRTHELTEIAELLTNSDCRLLTLYGPGGMGKTRLALQAGVKVQARFRDGVCFAPLQSVQSIDFLVPSVADALDLPLSGQKAAEAQLLDFLQDQEMLLILDNCGKAVVNLALETGGTTFILWPSRSSPRRTPHATSTCMRRRTNTTWTWVWSCSRGCIPTRIVACFASSMTAGT